MRVHVCLDLDGTALDAERRAPARALEALHAAIDGVGGRLAVATSRCVHDVARLLRDVPAELEAWCSDGACRGRVNRGAIVGIASEVALSPVDASRSTEHLLAAGAGVLLFTGAEEQFAIVGHADAASEALALLRDFGDERPVRLVEDLDQLRALAGRVSVRAVSVLDRTERAASVAAALSPSPGAHVLHYGEDRAPGYSWVDVVDAGVSKRGAVRALREEDAGPCRVLVAGNGLNDVPLFEEADWRVCPSASEPRLSAIADVVADVPCGAELVDRVRREAVALMRAGGPTR